MEFSPAARMAWAGTSLSSDVRIYQHAVGKSLAWVYFWNNWYENPHFPYQTASWIRANGSVPYIRLMLLSSPTIPRPDPVYSLQNIIDGKFDPLSSELDAGCPEIRFAGDCGVRR